MSHSVREGHLETARVLLQRGARASAAAVREGLLTARQRGHLEMVAMLEAHGALEGEGPPAEALDSDG